MSLSIKLSSLARHYLREWLGVPRIEALASQIADQGVRVAELSSIECVRAAVIEAEDEYYAQPSEKNGRRVTILREERRELQVGYGRRRGART